MKSYISNRISTCSTLTIITKRISLFLFLLIVPAKISGQLCGSVAEYSHLNTALPIEKVFLHLDRPNYMDGDTIWFKAYSWYGYEQVPDTLSGILYVDLINSSGKIKLKRKLLIRNGTSQGDFCLDTTISPGSYTIRAYTRHMQNLNMGEPFYQTLTISPAYQNFYIECNPAILKQPGSDSLQIGFRFFEIDQTGDLKNTYSHKVNYSIKIGDRQICTGNTIAENTKEQILKYSLSGISNNDSVALFELYINDNRLTYEKQFRIPLQQDIDLQFFPEGGLMVNGLESKVAFKAIGTEGLSREVTGIIKTNDEEEVTTFKTSNKGMGFFLLKPEYEKKYFAHLWYNNRKFIIPLPSSKKEGSVMSVNQKGSDDNLNLTVKESPSPVTRQKYVVGTAHGKIWFSASIIMKKDSCCFRVPYELLPEGICRLTLLDDIFKPECERLIYVDKHQRFKIEIKPDSSSYGTRSRVTLLIKTTGVDSMPLQTDLSLVVVDREQVIKNGGIRGICAYKLLESELQGSIEDIDNYFNPDNSIKSNELDLLLLTQGYRKFLSDSADNKKQVFHPEKSFSISGKIELPGKRNKNFNYNEINLTLLCRTKGVFIDQSNPDSLGNFTFNIPLLDGKINTFLQAATQKGKPFRGYISINDTVIQPKFARIMPLNSNLTPVRVENINMSQAAVKTEISKIPWYGKMSVTLGEVVVKAKAKNWYQNFEKEALKISNLDSLDPGGNRYKNIYELLVQEYGAHKIIIPGVGLETILLPCISIALSESFPIYVINGKTYFDASEDGEMAIALLRNLSFMKVNEIKRLMVLPPGEIASHYADAEIISYFMQSLVVIETYSNNSYRGDPQGIKNFLLDGLDTPRFFYSPQYESPSQENPIYDGRATLYWDPSIRTDSSGQAKVEFYTNDRKSALEVVVNGIEVGSGNPGQGQIIIGR